MLLALISSYIRKSNNNQKLELSNHVRLPYKNCDSREVSLIFSL
jgi:hypothetical protein